jgi:hypothetical protein
MAYSPVSPPTPGQLEDIYHLDASAGAAFIGTIVSAVYVPIDFHTQCYAALKILQAIWRV